MPTSVSLSQLVDLSLGTPEIGSVNFNVMHTLLHAMIRKLNIADSKADINEHDRDFLASGKIRAKSTLSDADSGRGEDSEDGISEKSGVPPFRPSPYHRLELKVEKMASQLEELNKLPSNDDLFKRTTKTKGDTESPVSDMWQYMQLKKRVDANEEGVGKLFSMIEDMMKQMKELKDSNKALQDKVKDLNLDDLMRRLAELEKITSEMNEKFALLPTPEELNQFVTWPALEDALKGVRDLMQPAERVVIEMSSQTEGPSRPGSSRPQSRMSTPGPSEQLLDILERLGALDKDHKTLKTRVDDIEEELKNKLDKSALEGLGVPTELLEQIGKLKEELDRLAALRDKTDTTNEHTNLNDSDSEVHTSSGMTSETADSLGNSGTQQLSSLLAGNQSGLSGFTSGSGRPANTPQTAFAFLASVVALLAKTRQSKQQDTDTMTESCSNELLNGNGINDIDAFQGNGINDIDAFQGNGFNDIDAFQGNGINDIEFNVLQQKVKVLEEKLKLVQELILDDSSHQQDVTDLTSWLSNMETKIAKHSDDITTVAESDVDSGKAETVVSSKKSEEKPKPKREIKKREAPKNKEDEMLEERGDEEDDMRNMIEEILGSEDITEVDSQVMLSTPELQATNERLKNLAHTLNDQLHSLRDKVFLLDHELKRMAKGVEFALMRAKVAGMNDMPSKDTNDLKQDSDALTRAQQAILQLQAEIEKLHHTTSDIIDENKERTRQIEDILKYCDKLQQEKADKDYVQMEVEVKADKKSLDNKVNTKLFDQTTDEINKMIKEILDKLAGHDEGWKEAYSKLTEDIDGKLDRLELDPLKEWLESRLKALNDKLKKYQSNMDWSEDDAAGIRKQLIQKFHCISCDRPVDMMPTGPIPSLPSQQGLNPTRSPRPYTTFELDQIRQHAKSYMAGKNVVNFERALAEKQIATLKKSDLRAFLVHFKNDFENLANIAQPSFVNPEITDYYATARPCGGSHTLTYPHKRNTKLTHLSHLFREEEQQQAPVHPPASNKEEIDVQGVDGHIYRGRYGQKLEAKLPSTFGTNNNSMSVHIRATSPHPPPRSTRSAVPPQQRGRPGSARTPPSPRPTTASAPQQSSRPQSARVKIQETTVPRPEEDEQDVDIQVVEQAQVHLDMQSTEPVGN